MMHLTQGRSSRIHCQFPPTSRLDRSCGGYVRDPAIGAPSEDTNWLEQEVAKYFRREKKVLQQDKLNRHCSRTELSKLRQGCMKLREQLFELCCKVQHDPCSVDF